MNNTYIKNIVRTITKSFSRYIAIMAIIALGVGFFSGLKCTKPSMVETGNIYMREHHMFDFKVMSTYGFTEEEIEDMADEEHVLWAEGSFTADFIHRDEEGEEAVLKAIALPDEVNTVRLADGRMPEAADECLADAYQYGSDIIGSMINISEENEEQTKECFTHKTYKVVGTAYTPIYLNNERGTTSLGNGRIKGFVYMLPEGMSFEYYNEMYVTCQNSYDIYTDEYDEFIEDIEDDIKESVNRVVNKRYEDIKAVAGAAISAPQIYVSDRSDNVGYICFENDSSIVESIAKVFPVFFFLIAALVCSTTMTRMIDDERGQIGTFRALGYSNTAIISKYMIYSGSAAIIGCILGYLAGTFAFPTVIWKCYTVLYGFAPIIVKKSASLLSICVLVSLICSMGTTYFACKNELRCMPADLIRPKAPAAGKRILLERIGFIWRPMKFLHKVTVRNVFRFKKRMLMMIIGIAGCTALVMTGLGLGDSISNIAEFQYGDIDVHDVEITFSGYVEEADEENVARVMGDDLSQMVSLYKTSVEYLSENISKTVYLEAVDEGDISSYVHFNIIKGEDRYPKLGEVMISEKLAEVAGIDIGDMMTFTYGDNETVQFTVSAVYENYVWHYAYITPESYEAYFGEECRPNTIYMNLADSCDKYEVGADLGEIDGVVNVLVIDELRNRVSNMMEVMNSIVWLVIGCAGALAFIVLFNLSNINITERVREIATIKVLGFYPRETGSYVFRENLVLTIMGIIVGLPLGIWLHSFVMSHVQIDMIAFKVVILPESYVAGVITVLLFLMIVDLIMRRKIGAIDMAESLKSVE